MTIYNILSGLLCATGFTIFIGGILTPIAAIYLLNKNHNQEEDSKPVNFNPIVFFGASIFYFLLIWGWFSWFIHMTTQIQSK